MIPVQSVIDLTTLALLVITMLILLPYMHKQRAELASLHKSVEEIDEEYDKSTGSSDTTNNDTDESDNGGSTPPVNTPGGEVQSDTSDDDDPTITDASDSDIF